MKFTKKHVLLISALAILMAICTVAGATLAYLYVKTNDVVNTFAPSNIGLTLTESDEDKQFKMIPGQTIAKDPTVTVTDDTDIDCYVFVKIVESAAFDNYIEEYGIASGRTKLGSEDGVYYRVVETTDTTKSFSVIAGNTVTVKSEVTKEMMTALKANGAVQPTLTFTAYAIQSAGFDSADEAWPYALQQSNTPS